MRVTSAYPADFDEATIKIIESVRPYTMTSNERISALVQAVRHIHRHRISGSLVECGVWRGGSMMAAALTLLDLGVRDRDLYLFDTFSGMVPPTAADVSYDGQSAAERLEQEDATDSRSAWCCSDIEEVARNVGQTGYPRERIHLVRGDIQVTIPDHAPDRIAILRLDTDWYESTKHELVHLYQRLEPNGILIVDDYGCWQGARRAVDEHLRWQSGAIYLHRIDWTGRMCVKGS